MANSDLNQNKNQAETIKLEIKKYLRYWYVFFIGLGLAFLIAFLYLRYTPPIYSSEAKIKILNKNKGLELPSVAFLGNNANINLENEIEILKSSRIISKVAENLDLTMQLFEEGNILTTEVNQFPFVVVKTVSDAKVKWAEYKLEVTKAGFKIGRENSENPQLFPDFTTIGVTHDLPFEVNPGRYKDFSHLVDKIYLIKFIPLDAVTRNVQSKLEVSKLGKSSDLIELSYKSESTTKNENILNELIKVFNEDGIEDRRKISLRTIEFIDERFELIVEELDSIETGIQVFKQTNDLISIEADAELGMTLRTETQAGIFEIESQILLLDLLKESLLAPDSDSNLLPQNIGLDSGDINNLIDQYNTLVSQREEMRSSAGQNNPQVQLLSSQMEDLKSNILASISAYEKQLSATKDQLESRNTNFKSKVKSIPRKEKIFLDIKRQQAIKQTLYTFLLQKREEAAINYAITEPSIKVVEYAQSSGWPLSPNSKSIYVMAFAGGIAVPFLIIYLIFFLDNKVRNQQDFAVSNFEIPLVGEIPKIEKNESLLFNNPNDSSVKAEAFRILSANVNYILPVRENDIGSVIFCTSSIKGEGKTYTSINLSLALSSINKKVLLIGADLRNPQIHANLELDKNTLGLADYLYDVSINWDDLIVKGFEKHSNHHIILSGSMPPNPAHLLTNGRFKSLMKEVREVYDYIIVDTAPTILVTDTMLVANEADATIYLIRANYTDKHLLEYSRKLFEEGKLKNMAYVLNGVDKNSSYGYGYNYGYNYGYGSEEVKKKKSIFKS